MGLFTYLSEEIYITVTNFKYLLLSFFSTLLIYSSIIYFAHKKWDCLLNLNTDEEGEFYFRFFEPQLWHLFWLIIFHSALCLIYHFKFDSNLTVLFKIGRGILIRQLGINFTIKLSGFTLLISAQYSLFTFTQLIFSEVTL